jgi:uncharacterized glyoxalase superfamily protein PhnB
MTEFKRNSLTSALCYKDARAMLAWLEKAYGFEPYLILIDNEGKVAHSEMSYGDSLVMIGSEWSDDHKSPASIGGKNTQTVHVHMSEGIDAHCEHARKAGAEILMEPETQFYGDRTYRARDPEGHIWTFGQTVKTTTPEEWEAESGFKTILHP